MRSRETYEYIEQHPQPNDDPLVRLDHVLDVFADSKDDKFVIRATSNVYGPEVVTGLTWGDLRAIRDHINDTTE